MREISLSFVQELRIVAFATLAISILCTSEAASVPNASEPNKASPLLSEPVENFTSNLPLIILTPLEGEFLHRQKRDATVSFIDVGADGRSRLSGRPIFSGPAGVAIRGNSSRLHPKKAYSVELRDEDGADLKVPLFGMPKESDWVLYASYTDKTFIRDVLAYSLWRDMGYYAPRSRYVEVFLAKPGKPVSMADYIGVYVLLEKVKRGKHRVNIEKLRGADATEPAVSGGYIIKKDWPDERRERFKTEQGLEFEFCEPKAADLTPAQRTWLTGYINQLESALYGPDFRNPETGYRKYLDVNSFVDRHWLVEASRNVDGYWSSTFLYKDRGGKLKLGPVWDWDLSFGNAMYLGGWQTNGWRWSEQRDKDYPWFNRLFEDPDSLQLYIDRWAVLRTNIFATSNVLARVDRLAAEVREAQARNYQRWDNLGKRIHPNKFVGQTYDEEVNWLKDWIAGRLTWIDSTGYPAPKLEILRSSEEGLTVALSCAVGSVYYTLDSSDPRLAGGGISPRAHQYREPFAVRAGTKVTARARSEYELWSAPTVRDGSKPSGEGLR